MCRIDTAGRAALALLLASGVGACASTGNVPRPFPSPGGAVRPAPSPAPEHAGPIDGYALAGTALSLRGSPYRGGGTDPSGFDCSGFTWYVFAQHGLQLPRTVGEQFERGAPVEVSSLRAGDLVFFDTTGHGATHVGILIGGDEFVHAPNSRGEVRVERLGSTYWSRRYLGARRVDP